MTPPHGIDEIKRVYGDPKLKRGEKGWTVDPAWERANLVIAVFPLIGRRLYVHRLIVEPLREVLEACEALRIPYEVKRIGCFNPRPKRTNPDAPSLHSFAVALDINPDTNPAVVVRPEDPFPMDIPIEWIDEFKKRGWLWGADFKPRADGMVYRDSMHLQFATGW